MVEHISFHYGIIFSEHPHVFNSCDTVWLTLHKLRPYRAHSFDIFDVEQQKKVFVNYYYCCDYMGIILSEIGFYSSFICSYLSLALL